MLASLTSIVRPIAASAFLTQAAVDDYEENPLLFSLVDAAKMRGYNLHETSAEVFHAYNLCLFHKRATLPFEQEYLVRRWADPMVWVVPSDADRVFLKSDVDWFTPSRFEQLAYRQTHDASLRQIAEDPEVGQYHSFVVACNLPAYMYACIARDQAVSLLVSGSNLPIVMFDKEAALNRCTKDQVVMGVDVSYLDVSKIYPEVLTGPNVGTRLAYTHYDLPIRAAAFDVVRG